MSWWIGGWMDGWVDAWVDGWRIDGWMDGWVDGWMVNGWVGGWMAHPNGKISHLVFQNFLAGLSFTRVHPPGQTPRLVTLIAWCYSSAWITIWTCGVSGWPCGVTAVSRAVLPDSLKFGSQALTLLTVPCQPSLMGPRCNRQPQQLRIHWHMWCPWFSVAPPWDPRPWEDFWLWSIHMQPCLI